MNKISKIIWSLFSGAMCLVYKTENANADWNTVSNNACTAYTGTDCTTGTGWVGTLPAEINNCQTSTIVCARISGASMYRERTCTSCKAGHTKVQVGKLFPQGGCPANSTSQQYYHYTCDCKCSNCNETSSWTAYGTGYQKYTGQACDCSSGTAQCKTTTKYRCAAGYYGSSTNGTSGCTQCPTPGTSPNGATSVSQCYIPGNTSYSDTTGTFAYKCNCAYDGTDSCDSGSSSSSSAA
ncbi:MAG: hypothetical protein K2M34_01510 [Alphaproteobacteria bacterium]|nr:hypothetical protein [Alphaproteobacteria bacterium]